MDAQSENPRDGHDKMLPIIGKVLLVTVGLVAVAWLLQKALLLLF